MNIVSTQYSLNNKSFEIYLSGCKGNPHCKECHNPELWDFNIGEDYKIKLPEIIKKLKRNYGIINYIWILGGEPLDNDHEELKDMIKQLNKTGIDIWLFTRNCLDKVPDDIKKLVSFIKCGRYLPEQKTEDYIMYGVTLASKNQKIYERGKDYV